MGRKKRSGPLRYRKTEHKFLEDLVLLLRVAGEMKLDPAQVAGGKARQAYSAAELSHWQTHWLTTDLPKKFDHLKPTALKKVFPGTDGLLTDGLLRQIMAVQAADHDRILAVQRGGVWRYAAHQGLHEEMVYTELAPCPPEMTTAMHLTKVPTARALLSNTPGRHGGPQGPLQGSVASTPSAPSSSCARCHPTPSSPRGGTGVRARAARHGRWSRCGR